MLTECIFVFRVVLTINCVNLYISLAESKSKFLNIIYNKKFWEELIAYFPFTTNWVFDTTIWKAVVLVLLMRGIW
jgi:hypothetical protein